VSRVDLHNTEAESLNTPLFDELMHDDLMESSSVSDPNAASALAECDHFGQLTVTQASKGSQFTVVK